MRMYKREKLENNILIFDEKNFKKLKNLVSQDQKKSIRNLEKKQILF